MSMSTLDQLQSATTIHEVAAILDVKTSYLSYLLYIKHPSVRYKTFSIPKRNGGVREIAAPADDLKLLQRRVARVLSDCLEEIKAAKALKDDVAHGFVEGRSIVTNARPHVAKRFVFNLDLKGFFPSITFQRLYGFLMKDSGFKLPKKAATILAQIACHEGRLPQGSPCSPAFSNLIGHILDVHLVALAAKNGCHYTRYADDLTFSTNKRRFPTAIARHTIAEPHIWVPGTTLAKLIAKCAFEINPTKTRMQYCDSRQEVTGLVVNRKVNVRADYRHRVRAMVHQVLTTGTYTIHATELATGSGSVVVKKPGTLNQLHGMLGFVDSIDLFNSALVQRNRYNYARRPERLSSKETMFLRFLLYRFFWAPEKPVVVCEGKTDNVYITHAIRSLAGSYPTLATVSSSGQVSLNVRVFKYTNSSTGRIIGNKSGGAAGLCTLMRHYRNEAKQFTAPSPLQPLWAAAGFMDTLLRWKMKPEVVYGNEKAIQPGVQA
jgi:RNA-directed DNA polymerase